MSISMREFWTLVHGMGFGALYLLASSGALVELYRWLFGRERNMSAGEERFLRVYLVGMAVLAWAAVLSGAYVVYSWYRAAVPAGTVDLAGYPQRLLLAKAGTAGWHSLGMEWKEHVAWLAPMAMTMVAFVFMRYGKELQRQRALRAAVMVFVLTSFAAAGVAGFFGAMIDKAAPVKGGATIGLGGGGER